MVKEDSFFKKTKRIQGQGWNKSDVLYANPLDRIAATIFDLFVVLTPLVHLITSPLRRDLSEFLLNSSYAEFYQSMVLISIVSIFVIIAYQSVMTYIKGGTLGQLLFGIQIRRIWCEQKLTFVSSLLRSLYWFVSVFIFFGFPLLSVFSDKRRRSFHERMTDTFTASKKEKRAVSHPGVVESSFVKGIYAALFGVVGLVALATIWQFAGDKGEGSYFKKMIGSSGECEAVTNAQKKWDSLSSYTPTRLQVAMTLYAAEEIEADCLDKESEFAFVEEGDLSLAYLAKSFVVADHPELSNAYLDRVCKEFPDSSDCEMSMAVDAWSEEDFDKVGEIFESYADRKKPDYVKVWGVKQFERQKNYEQVVRLLDNISGQRALASFLLPIRAKALWKMNNMDLAKSSFAGSVDYLSDTVQYSVAKWMCFEDLLNGCEATKEVSCKVFESLVSNKTPVLRNKKVAMTHLALQSCKGEKNFEFLVDDRLVQRIANIVFEKENSKMLLEIAKNQENPSDVRLLSFKFWLDTQNDASVVQSALLSDENQENQIHYQRMIFSKLYSLKAYGKAYSFAQANDLKLKNNKALREKLVVAAYRVGNRQHAFQLIADTENKQSISGRLPASTIAGEYDWVLQKMMKEYNRR